MTSAPHPSGAGAGTDRDARAPGNEANRNGARGTPRYLRVRLVVALAVIATALAGLVALDARDPDSTSPGRGTDRSVAAKSQFDEAFGSFGPITRSGRGSSTIPLPEGASAGIVTATYEGPGFFDVGFRKGRTSYPLISWVAVRGPYRGEVPFGLFSWPQADSLRVWTGQGPWTVTIAPVSSADELPQAVSGTDGAVFLYTGDRAGWVFDQKHGSDRLFVYQAIHLTPGHLPTQLHWMIEGSQTVHLAAGPSVVVVSTRGGWSATAK